MARRNESESQRKTRHLGQASATVQRRYEERGERNPLNFNLGNLSVRDSYRTFRREVMAEFEKLERRRSR